MIDTLLSMGIIGILAYIACKMAVVNDVSHEIRDILLKGRLPPPSSIESSV